MKRVGIRAAAAVAALSVLGGCNGSLTADPAAYPEKDITFYVPYAPGGSTDPISRQFTKQLEKLLDANVTVENRDGASATIGTSAVVEANPDGYTIGLSSNSALSYQPLVNSNLPYKSPQDYQPLIKLADLPTVLAVPADAPWKTFEDFMKAAKANPGKHRISTSGALTAPDLSVKELSRTSGVNLKTVPFTGGGGEALTALLGGKVEATAGYAATLRPQVESGDLRVLAAFHEGTYEAFPEAQSIPEAGYDVTLPAAYYVIAPNDMPGKVLEKLTSAAKKAVATSEFKSFQEKNGYISDPITGDAIREELQGYHKSYQELNEFLGK
ncbi:MAG: Bug family tripartite tricarboxylate transporter substrate binding protein [Micromonosporaceae bacterium]